MNASYSKIIQTIDSMDRAKPFAIWEVRDKSECSSSSVTRALRVLCHLRFVEHLNSGYLGRHYRTTARWDTLENVKQMFELAKVMKMDVA